VSISTGIANFGMIIGYERNYFLHEQSNDKSGALLSTVMTFVALNMLALLLAVYYWQEVLSRVLLGQAGYGGLLMLVFAGMCLSNLTNYYMVYLKNKGLAKKYVIISTVKSLVSFLLILLFLLYFGAGIHALGYALFISSVILFIIVGVLQIKDLPISFNKVMLIDALKISFPLTPRVLFGFLNTQFDKMMLGMLNTLGGVGLYSVSQKAAYLVFEFMTALDRVFLPEVYRRFFSQEEQNNDQAIGQYLTPFAYVSILFALMCVLFSEELFNIIFPDSYAAGVEIVIVLTMYYASLFFGKIAGTQIIYAKKTHITSLLSLIGIVINVSLNIPMIMQWGALGAAWATMVSGVIITIFSYRIAQRYAPIQWDWKPILWMYGTLLVAAMFVLLNDILITSYILILMIKIIIIISYLLLGVKFENVRFNKLYNIYNTKIKLIFGNAL